MTISSHRFAGYLQPTRLPKCILVLCLAAALSACGAQDEGPDFERNVSGGGDNPGGGADAAGESGTDAGIASDAEGGDGGRGRGDDDIDEIAPACEAGGTICEQDMLERCDDGVHSRTRSCSQGCTDEQSCAGDGCETAVTIDLSAVDEAIVLQGDQVAYTNQWSAEEREGCSLYEGEPAGPTEGPEIFFRLTGHQSGDRVQFSGEGGGTTFAFYLMEGCSASSCIDSGVYRDETVNQHRWEAKSGADIWVAAEVFGPTRDRPFRIEIERE